MTWLLSIVGIGGIGAALFLIPGAAENALRALGAALGVIRDNPWQCAVLALLLACGGIWHVKGGQVERANRRADVQAALVAKWKAANEAATQWALAEKRAKETAANDIKDRANVSREIAQAAGARAGADYRRSNQCVRFTPAEGRGLNPDLPRPDSVAGQFAPQAGNAELVGITVPSFNVCTVNSIDFDNAYEWGQKLVKAGLAR